MGLERDDSILKTIRQMIGPSVSYDVFDTDLIVHINAAFSRLCQLGVGPETPFHIHGEEETWFDFGLPEGYQEEVKQFISSFLGGIVKSLAGDQLKADEIPSLEEVYKDAKIEIEDFISEEIHLDTGWPIEWFFTRRTLIEMEGKSMNQLIKRTVSMLFEDDEE